MGLTVLDAGVVIAFVSAADVHRERARDAMAVARSRGDDIVLPASAYGEALVGPTRSGPAAIRRLQTFLVRLPVRVVSLDPAMAEAAARLWADHGARLKLPDALVLATASVLDADYIITTDRRWPTRAALGLRAEIAVL
ncbi:MAG: PIN domain-containing protein [Dehalococcoidia bacterium]